MSLPVKLVIENFMLSIRIIGIFLIHGIENKAEYFYDFHVNERSMFAPEQKDCILKVTRFEFCTYLYSIK